MGHFFEGGVCGDGYLAPYGQINDPVTLNLTQLYDKRFIYRKQTILK